jgi:hypothetical protein
MDYDLHEEQQVPPGVLTGISFNFTTQTDIVSTFNWLMVYWLFIWWCARARFIFFLVDLLNFLL